jgi:hypothetical protein
MPRTAEEIVSQANQLAKRFEEHEPDAASIRDAASLRKVRKAFQRRAGMERELGEAVLAARADGQS